MALKYLREIKKCEPFLPGPTKKKEGGRGGQEGLLKAPILFIDKTEGVGLLSFWRRWLGVSCISCKKHLIGGAIVLDENKWKMGGKEKKESLSKDTYGNTIKRRKEKKLGEKVPIL